MNGSKLTLADHVFLTYRSLRIALVITCLALPLALIIVGAIDGFHIQDSLSDYYYVEFPPKLLRTIFIGLLFLLGGLLIAYRGFNQRDNWIHNLAGAFAWGVAIFPMKCPHTTLPLSQLCYSLGPGYLHFTSAFLLFSLAIASIWYNGGRRFKNICHKYIPDLILSFKVARAFSAVIVFCGIASAAVMLGIGGKQLFGEYVWLPESLGFIGFGIYWGFLTFYISVANKRATGPKEPGGEERLAILAKEEEEILVRPTRAIP